MMIRVCLGGAGESSRGICRGTQDGLGLDPAWARDGGVRHVRTVYRASGRPSLVPLATRTKAWGGYPPLMMTHSCLDYHELQKKGRYVDEAGEGKISWGGSA